jgi:hypothetical protein
LESESVTFRIFGLAGKDARQKVGDYVRLAWSITNENLGSKETVDALKEIGQDFPIEEVIQELDGKDCYQGWTEQHRYFLFRYEEHLVAIAGQSVNESQWSKIWADEP